MKIFLSEKEFLEAEIKRLEHNEEVLMNALLKPAAMTPKWLWTPLSLKGS